MQTLLAGLAIRVPRGRARDGETSATPNEDSEAFPLVGEAERTLDPAYHKLVRNRGRFL